MIVTIILLCRTQRFSSGQWQQCTDLEHFVSVTRTRASYVTSTVDSIKFRVNSSVAWPVVFDVHATRSHNTTYTRTVGIFGQQNNINIIWDVGSYIEHTHQCCHFLLSGPCFHCVRAPVANARRTTRWENERILYLYNYINHNNSRIHVTI